MAPVLDHRELHAEADAEVRDRVLTSVAYRSDLALNATLAEAAGHQNGIHPLQQPGAALLDVGGLDEVDAHAGAGLHASVGQRFVERDVGIAYLHVLSDHRDVDLTGRVRLRIDHALPCREVGRARLRLEAEFLDDDPVEILRVQQHGDLVDVTRIDRRDHRPLLDIGEQRDLAPLLGGQRVLRAAQQDVGLDADATEFFDRMLGGLGLDLAGTADHRHQRQVHEHTVAATEFHAQLADRLQERQRLDVTNRATDLDHADVGVAGAEQDVALDLVGDVRDHLHRRAEVIATPLLGDHALVDAAGGEVAVATGDRAHEALVVTEVEVGLRAIVGDEDLAVLERAHGARIDIDVGVEFDHRDLQAAGLEDGAQ